MLSKQPFLEPRVVALPALVAGGAALVAAAAAALVGFRVFFGSAWPFLLGALGVQVEDNVVLHFTMLAVLVVLPSIAVAAGVFRLLSRGLSRRTVRIAFTLYVVGVFSAMLLSGREIGDPGRQFTGAANWDLSFTIDDWMSNPVIPLFKAAIFIPIGAYLFSSLISGVLTHIVLLAAVSIVEFAQLIWQSGVADIGGILSAYVGILAGMLLTGLVRQFPVHPIRLHGQFFLTRGSSLHRPENLEII